MLSLSVLVSSAYFFICSHILDMLWLSEVSAYCTQSGLIFNASEGTNLPNVQQNTFIGQYFSVIGPPFSSGVVKTL
jgi:hypothetical protein